MSSGYPSGLTASAFEILIHYYWTPVDPDDMVGGDIPYTSAKELEAAGLLEVNKDRNPPGLWTLTERGLFLARHIVNLPLPVVTWQMPGSVPNGNGDV